MAIASVKGRFAAKRPKLASRQQMGPLDRAERFSLRTGLVWNAQLDTLHQVSR
jgi:hypothetical protein